MTSFKHLKISILFTVFGLLVSQASFAGETKEGEKFDPSVMINHHIMDAHSWEIYHGLTLPLPVILYSEEKGLDIFSSANFYDADHNVVPYNGYVMEHEHISLESGAHVYDISITKNVFFLFINALIMILIFLAVARGYKKNAKRAPRGIQSFFEPIIIYVRDEIVKPNIGAKYERYLPYLLTLFFFIWFGNLLGLLPAAANLTGNIAVTLVLSVFSLIITLASGRKTYWLHILDPLGNSMPWVAKIPLYLILWPIELIGIITKPFSLMVRLFANITAGHIIILSIISLTFITQSLVVGLASTAFATVMNMLELFVALLQAYVFTLLTSMYFGQAVEEHH
ncbi:MAG: F0F1 ATP synthase subunit A [Reichenbachiella sp.]|uniref:F0F1 ATP synthase subunit A n=1 Tax=Reichenbachiella sp. TaxID=2184521 RepID=UPI003263D943